MVSGVGSDPVRRELPVQSLCAGYYFLFENTGKLLITVFAEALLFLPGSRRRNEPKDHDLGAL